MNKWLSTLLLSKRSILKVIENVQRWMGSGISDDAGMNFFIAVFALAFSRGLKMAKVQY